MSNNDRGGPVRTLTLLTGDRVTVLGDNPLRATITPGPGRTDVTFTMRRTGGHLEVIPSDTVTGLQQGRLDRRLFDIDTLVEFRYDDRRTDLPLILMGETTARGGQLAGGTVDGAAVVRTVPGGVAVAADKAHMASVWGGLAGRTRAVTPGAAPFKIWLDGLRRPTLDRSVPQIGAPTAWAAGYTGAGVRVAVLDTGVDTDHPDLAGRVIESVNFSQESDPRDLVGHGTHVASTIVGQGTASGGRYRGVAPDVQLLSGKVCGQYGCPESATLAGMYWAVAEKRAKIVNLSLGGADSAGQDLLEAAVESLSAKYGTLFVVSAGNDGGAETVNSPASADAALAVGAVTKADDLAEFSSRGPRIGDGAIKPDLTAPGVDITAARSKDGSIGQPGAAYTALSGTSMATPHVAGAAAILAQQHPDWTAAVLKAALMGSARSNPAASVPGQGAGRVDVARAVTQPVAADAGSLSFGRQLWPHQDDVPMTRRVGYRNDGATPIVLDIAVSAVDPNGAPTPAGMFTTSLNQLTVPAHGAAAVDVTVDTRVRAPDGRYFGSLSATAAGVAVRIPLAVEREVESYNLTLSVLDRTGQPTPEFLLRLASLDRPTSDHVVELHHPDGVVHTRLPKGRYAAMSEIFTPNDGDAQLIEPEFNLDRPTAVMLDARTARPVEVAVPDADATLYAVQAESVLTDAKKVTYLGTVMLGSGKSGPYFGQNGDRRTEGLVTQITASLARAGSGEFRQNSPYAYHLAWTGRDRNPTGIRARYSREQLATVHAEYAGEGPAIATELPFPAPPEVDGWASLTSEATQLRVRLPGDRTHYYSTGDRWTDELIEETDAPMTSRWLSPLKSYQSGQVSNERRIGGVFGPGFPAGTIEPLPWASRDGDVLLLQPPLHVDHTGWAGRMVGNAGPPPPPPDGSLSQSVPPTFAQRTVLFRNGVQIVNEPFQAVAVEVPPDQANYRLEVSSVRGAPFTLSTEVNVAWTFPSGHGEANLPLSTVRFLPTLDRTNTAPAGQTFTVPFSVDRQAGSGPTTVRDLAVDVSYDDGVTWQRVTVERHGITGSVRLQHPATAGYVSLRARAADGNGNTVSQTIIRAYRID